MTNVNQTQEIQVEETGTAAEERSGRVETAAYTCFKLGRCNAMRSLDFGQGAAATQIPDHWVSSVDERGTTVANPPDQDAVFLWLSTLSWEMPATPDFSPANYFLQRPDAKPVVRTEERGDAVITYSVDARVEDGVTFETHQFQVLPKRSVDGLGVAAFLTLSVRRDEDAGPFIQQALDDTWSIAWRVAFRHEPAA